MKKIIIILIAVLVGIFLSLSLLDNGGYALEKKLWKAQKSFEEIARDPKAVPDQNFEALIARYRRIIADYPKASLTPKVYIKIGSIYLLKNDFDRARVSFEEAIAKNRDKPDICAEALVQVGQTYEKQSRPEEALKIYSQIMAKYPLTEFGLNAPLYVANYLTSINRLSDAKAALFSAEAFYKKMIAEQSGTRWEFDGMRFLATTYLVQKDQKSGIKTLGDILLKFSKSEYLTPQNASFLVRSINTVSVANLQDYDLPISIYEKFMAQNAEHPFNDFLTKTIAGLKELKEKNVGIRYVPNQGAQQ